MRASHVRERVSHAVPALGVCASIVISAPLSLCYSTASARDQPVSPAKRKATADEKEKRKKEEDASPGAGEMDDPATQQIPESRAETGSAAGAVPPPPPVASPHPLVTEVLYAVPTSGGDANADGTRHVSGDEFVELVNPHDKPIQLRGYRIADKDSAAKGEFLFQFPACELKPGQVVVVFNGNSAVWKGRVGDARGAPKEGYAALHGALVFTMGQTSQRRAWNNAGDIVLLTDPKGGAVSCAWWGEGSDGVPEGVRSSATALLEELPVNGKGSVERVGFSVGVGGWSARDGASAAFPGSAQDAPTGRFTPGHFRLPAKSATGTASDTTDAGTGEIGETEKKTEGVPTKKPPARPEKAPAPGSKDGSKPEADPDSSPNQNEPKSDAPADLPRDPADESPPGAPPTVPPKRLR